MAWQTPPQVIIVGNSVGTNLVQGPRMYLSGGANITLSGIGQSIGISADAAGGAWPANSVVWSKLGVYMGSAAPGPGIQYSDWAAGSTGFFMWVRIP